MSDLKDILVPDIGADEVDVTEILVAVGDSIEEEQGIITVEGDKASMEVPAPCAGVVKEIVVNVGDKVSEGSLIIKVAAEGAAPAAEAPAAAPAAAAPAPAAAPAGGGAEQVVAVPDIGADEVDVTEILVAVGDTVSEEQGLITVEGDKASMEVPSPAAGVVKSISINIGDKVSEGSVILVLEGAGGGAAAPAAPAAEAPAAAPAAAGGSAEQQISVPDIGADEVDVTEILVAVGDTVSEEQGLITVEGDKASMEVPSPAAGVVKSISVSVGDKVSEGSAILVLEGAGGGAAAPAPAAAAPAPAASAPSAAPKAPPVPHHPGSAQASAPASGGRINASPSVRRIGREFGVDLSQVKGTGRKGRIVKQDVAAYVKYELSRPKATATSNVAGGFGLQVIDAPKVDFSKFGEVEERELSRIQKISGPFLHRNWVTIPHVTQFDEVDTTELEAFRKQQNALNAKMKSDVKITPLVFMMKAAAKALVDLPKFNTSLSADGESLIYKKYVNVGVAVDTPNGLVVPVFKDVDKKTINELSLELMAMSKKARDGKLTAKDMSGGCFTISSLGGIGGTQFTPIVNAPEVAILGVSRSEMKPKWNGSEFVPKLILPLALSYDHRVIDGADGARFITTLNKYLSDIRNMIM